MATEQTFSERMTERGGVRSVSVDGVSVQADSIDEEIKLDEYNRRVTSQDSLSQPHFGIRFGQIIPHGGGG